MQADYDDFFKRVGITEIDDKMTVFNFMDTLFNITIEMINNEQNK